MQENYNRWAPRMKLVSSPAVRWKSFSFPALASRAGKSAETDCHFRKLSALSKNRKDCIQHRQLCSANLQNCAMIASMQSTSEIVLMRTIQSQWMLFSIGWKVIRNGCVENEFLAQTYCEISLLTNL